MRFSVLLVVVAFTVASDAAQTESFDVTTFITNRFAETTITSKVRNDGGKNQEIKFQSLLPKEAFISAFSLTVNGITYESIVEEKEKANRTFQAAKQLNKTAGLVETRKSSTKTFRTSVNVAAGEVVEFKLVYQQLLRRIKGKYRHQVILLGNQMTDFLSIKTHICESEPITKVESLPILNSQGEEVTPSVQVDKETNYAVVTFLKGGNDDLLSNLSSSGGSFVIEYELEPTDENGSIVLNNGHFVYFYAPNITIPPRRVIFVLDVSGSMFGLKIGQLIEAMVNIIDKLTKEDRFTIITFSSDVDVYKGKNAPLSEGTRENVESAKEFLRKMSAGGGTNIDSALQTALDILNKDTKDQQDPEGVNYIVFLTDGQPTAGISNTNTILQRLDETNVKNFSIHAIGFGDGVDANFLKSMAARNDGTWTQILSDINAALQIQNYLDELTVNLLKNIVINYTGNLVDEFVMQPQEQFLAGGEIIAFGKFKEDIDPANRGPHFLKLSGDAGGEVSLSVKFFMDQRPTQCAAIEKKSVDDFGTKAFGLAKVVEVLRQYDAEDDELVKEELRLQAIAMSLYYKLVTSVTSLLVIKPEDKKEIEEKLKETPTSGPVLIGSTKTPPRASTTTQPPRTPWVGLQGDPHIVMHLSNNITACFNWKGKSGEIFNLINDPHNDIVINGLMDGPKPTSNSSHANFITKLVVLLKREHLVIKINPTEVIVKDVSSITKRQRPLRLPMVNMEYYRASYGPVTFEIDGMYSAHTVLRVILANDLTFVVNLFHYNSKNPTHIFRHLDLVVEKSGILSKNVGGVFGRFPKDSSSNEASSASIQESGDKTYLWLNDVVTTVKKRTMMIPLIHERIACWFVAKPEEILGVPFEDFRVESLMEVPKV